MKKLKKLALGLKLLLKKPSLINLVVDSKDRWEFYLENKFPKKLKTANINQFLNKEVQLNTFTFLGGGSLPTDILLLKAICEKFKNCSYFEIGTWRGESVINVAEIAKECYTLNLSKDEILALNLPKKYAELHGFFSKEKTNINHLYGNSMQFDFAGLQKRFDVIFIDGDHTYDYVKNDTEKVFTYLVKENSVVIWHDYASTPENPRPEVLAGILDGLPIKEHKYLYHVSNTLCAIYTKEKLDANFLDFPVKPELNFKVKINLKKL